MHDMKFKNLDSAQKRRLLISFFAYVITGTLILSVFLFVLYNDRADADEDWYSYLSDPVEQQTKANGLSEDAQIVNVGTYVENLREVNLKSSYFRVEFMLWFNWTGPEDVNPAGNFRIYKGLINRATTMEEIHNGDEHYQLLSVDVSVSKNYETRRFPLESHQLRFYVESTDPIQEVRFVADRQNSGMNKNITVTGYKFLRNDIGEVTYTYDSNHGHPDIGTSEMTSEIVTAFEINRSDFGMYFKCFIALAGTVTWVLITLFICTYHHVDPLGMVPAALFGTVSNIMIGASLLPDALQMGLLEFVNLWGVLSILGGAIAIININQVRKNGKDMAYTGYYGKFLFYTILAFAVAGQLLMPLVAYIW